MKKDNKTLSIQPQVSQSNEAENNNSPRELHQNNGQNPETQKQIPTAPEKRRVNYWMISTLVLCLLVLLGGVFYYWIHKNSLKSQKNNLSTKSITSTSEKVNLSVNGQLLGKLAFIRDDNLWFSNNGVEKQITTDAVSAEIPYWTGLPKLWYSNPQISHDGARIAFLKNTNTDARALMVSDIDGKNIKQLANDIAWTMPIIQWSKDDIQIYYPSSGGMESINVKSVNVVTEQIQEYGQFAMGTGCGGGSSDPADHVSAGENITSVGGGVQVFSISPQNDFIVHTILCTGSGLGILDLTTKQDKTIDDKSMRAIISPDGKSIAATSGKNVVIFDIEGKIQKTFSVEDTPLVLLWSPDGKTIYYSSSKLLKSLDYDDEIALDILGSSPTSYRVNTSTLWKLSVDSGKDEKIMDFDAHNIKPIFVANQKLLVVEVENATELFEYVSQQKTKDNMVKYYPKVNLIEVNLSSLSSTVIANKTQQSFFLP